MDKDVAKNKAKYFPLVAVGASAGGLESFRKLFSEIPADIGMSFVIIQHLDPTHGSILPDILQKDSLLQVLEITEDTVIKENMIYTAPPNKVVDLKDDKLILNSSPKRGYNFIDHFMRSLAFAKKHRSIGILLSGNGSDGTSGFGFIKAEGGITLVAERKAVKYSSMVLSAINAGCADYECSFDFLVKELRRISKHPFIVYKDEKKLNALIDEPVTELSQILRLILLNHGVDFRGYKLSTVKRRLMRRMVLSKFDNLSLYLNYLKKNKEEVKLLYDDLLINVTYFFRDKQVFETLEKSVFPPMITEHDYDDPIRIWVPGCSSGEEVYSIGITLIECLNRSGKNIPVQIFATDVSDKSIEKARNAIYSESAVAEIPPDILSSYFKRINDDSFQIKEAIRDLCLFAKHDILKDPPFSKIDLISCRNLLIYLSSSQQKKIIPIFNYALKRKGVLLLGSSESIGEYAALFKLTDKKHKLYEKKVSVQKFQFDFNYSKGSILEKTKEHKIQMNFPGEEIQKEADKLILEKYAIPSILVNEHLEILQFRGKVTNYIKPSPGMASLNLFKMVREGISLDLNAAIRKAKKESKIITGNSYYNSDGIKKNVKFEIVPVKKENSETYYLILFHEPAELLIDQSINVEPFEEGEIDKLDVLKKELISTREHLQTMIEERDITNEELLSAIEEIQSSNEELQSTNEELETAKEELQSTNEELITVNEELENRNNELTQVNNDLINLLGNVNIPMIMIGADMKIKRFTTKAERLWNLIGTDIGRPLSDLNPNIEIPKMKENIDYVLDTLEMKEMEIKDKDNNWYSMRIRPYKTIENKIDGVVITFIDIGDLKDSVDAEKKARILLEAIVDGLNEPFLVLNKNNHITLANDSVAKILRLKKDELKGKSLYSVGNWDWILTLTKAVEDLRNLSQREIKFDLNSNEGNILSVNAKKISDDNDYVYVRIEENVRQKT